MKEQELRKLIRKELNERISGYDEFDVAVKIDSAMEKLDKNMGVEVFAKGIANMFNDVYGKEYAKDFYENINKKYQ